MTVISSDKDPEALTLTFVAEFDAPVDRVWQIWEDPRQLERWWGPPGWPATFDAHDVTPGGRASYYMTGPEGEKAPGWWHFTEVDAPTRLAFDDGFANENGEPDESMPVTKIAVTLEPAGSDASGTGAADGSARTRMTTVNTFESLEQLEQLVAMGMEDGMRLAMAQIDEVLAS